MKKRLPKQPPIRDGHASGAQVASQQSLVLPPAACAQFTIRSRNPFRLVFGPNCLYLSLVLSSG